MSTSAPDYHPSLSKSSTGLTSGSESRSERAPSPVLEDREPNLADRVKERMRPRARSDSYSSTATTLNQFDTQCVPSSSRPRRTSTDLSHQDREKERKQAARRSTEVKPPPMKRSSRSTFSDVGRHSNDWLFGGFSVKDTAKGLLKRRDS